MDVAHPIERHCGARPETSGLIPTVGMPCFGNRIWRDSRFHRHRLVEGGYWGVPLGIWLSVGRFDGGVIDGRVAPEW